jgi:hypothetical protein
MSIVALAVGLRCHQLGTDSLWHDELWGMEMAVGHDATQYALPGEGILTHPPDLLSLDPATPWWQVWSHMHLDTHPPLFHLTLRLWQELFGTSEAAVRSLPAIWSVLALILLFDALRIHNGPTAALWAAALMAVAAPQIQYAQEARSYALLLFEGMLALDMLVRLERDGPGLVKAAVLGLAIVAMALTHYFSAGAIIGIAVYAGVCLRGRTRAQVLLAVAVAGVLGVMLWGHPFWLQRQNFSHNPLVDWLDDPSDHPLAKAVGRLVLLCSRFLFDSAGWQKPLAAVAVLLLILPGLALRRSPRLAVWWIWLVCTIAPVATIDVVQHTMHLAYIRYVLLAAPAAYALLAMAGDWLPIATRRWAPLVPAGALLLTATAIPFRAYHPSWRPDWRGIARTIAAHRLPDEPVCCVGPCADGFWAPDGIYIEMNYYLRPLAGPMILINDPSPLSTMPTAGAMLHGHETAWAIVAGSGTDQQWPPAGWVIDRQDAYPQIGTLEHLHQSASTR